MQSKILIVKRLDYVSPCCKSLLQKVIHPRRPTVRIFGDMGKE
jgi:hypothetical protein